MWPWFMRGGMQGGPFSMQGSMFDELAIVMKDQAKKEHAADRLSMLAASAPSEIPDWFEGPGQPPVPTCPVNPYPNPKGSKEGRAKGIADSLLGGNYDPDSVNSQIENFEQPIKKRMADFIAAYLDWHKQLKRHSVKAAKDRYFSWREHYAREMMRWLDR